MPSSLLAVGEQGLRLSHGRWNRGRQADAGGVSALVIVDPESRPHLDTVKLGEVLHLTLAEARVAAAIVEGARVADVAAQLGISVGTVRMHVKRTLAKTGCRRQSELVCLVGWMRLALSS